MVHGPHSENPARAQHARTATRNMSTHTHHALDGFLSEVCLSKSQWAHSLKCIYFAVFQRGCYLRKPLLRSFFRPLGMQPLPPIFYPRTVFRHPSSPLFSIRPRALKAVTEQGLGKSAIHVERVHVNTPNTQTLSVWQSEGIFLHTTMSNLICTPAHCWQPFAQASPEQSQAFTGLLGQLPPPVSGGRDPGMPFCP